jgi:hypothetical protein
MEIKFDIFSIITSIDITLVLFFILIILRKKDGPSEKNDFIGTSSIERSYGNQI